MTRFSDLARELLIRWYAWRVRRLMDAYDAAHLRKVAVNARLCELCNSRSQRQVERMERARGLR